jgi:alkylhydroperoxidase family enzyme
MPLIKVVPPEKAEGKVKDAYAIFEQLGMKVPRPSRMFSVSPELVDLRRRTNIYFKDHPNLSLGLQALIRMMVAEEIGNDYCVSINSQLLRGMGIMDDDQLAAVMADPDSAPLTDKEKAMLLFVLKAINNPEAMEAHDLAYLHALGWSDGDIFDATAHAAEMISTGLLLRIFKMGQGS